MFFVSSCLFVRVLFISNVIYNREIDIVVIKRNSFSFQLHTHPHVLACFFPVSFNEFAY